MKKALILLSLLTCLMGCEEDYYPSGLYGSQVEYMLCGGSTKVWHLSRLTVGGQDQPVSSCEDSVKVIFEGTVNGSGAVTRMVAYDLRYRAGCQVFDTIYYGVLTASTAVGESVNPNLFTDSLLFEDGEIDYLIVEYIDPEHVTWVKRDSVTAVYTMVSGVSAQ